MSDGYYESESFTIDDYGTYTVGANIVYQDFVDLSYSMEESEIIGHAPVAKNKPRYFVASKKDGKYSFSIKESSIITDPENEELTLVSVIQGNPDNTVSVEHKDGYIIVVAEKSGNIAFSLEFSDESGAVSTITLEGKVRDKVVKMMEDIFALLLIVLFVVKLISRNAEKKRCKQEIEENKIKIEEIHEEIQKTIKGLKETYVLDDVSEYNALYGAIENVCEDEFILQCFGLGEVVQYNVAESKDIVRKIKVADTLINQKEEFDSIEIAKKKYRELRRIRNTTNASIVKLETFFKELSVAIKKFTEQSPITNADVKKAKESLAELKKVMGSKIECTLEITGANNIYSGMFVGVDKKGIYRLDKDVKMSKIGCGYRALAEISEKIPEIILYGYQDEEGEKGIVFRSVTPFQIKEEADGDYYNEYTFYNLSRDKMYRFNTRSSEVGELKIAVCEEV